MPSFGVCKPTKDPCSCKNPEYSIGGMCFNCKKTKRIITDTERLDFLISFLDGIQLHSGTWEKYYFRNYKSPREAIDAAIKGSD